MAVPAHDERDYEFANKFNLEIVKVINSKDDFYSGSGEIINSGKYDGIDSLEFKALVCEILEKKGMGKKTVNYKLRDWIFTRQRYWGEPIPILHSEDGSESVDEKDLPLELPEVDSYLPTADGMSPLARNDEWKSVLINGKKYLRETNTMPQWAGSCWYYLRFLDQKMNLILHLKKVLNIGCPLISTLVELNMQCCIYYTQDFGIRFYMT